MIILSDCVIILCAGISLTVTLDQTTAVHHGQHLREKAPEQRALAYFLLRDLFIFIAAGLSLETTYKMLENKVSEKVRDGKRGNAVAREE